MRSLSLVVALVSLSACFGQQPKKEMPKEPKEIKPDELAKLGKPEQYKYWSEMAVWNESRLTQLSAQYQAGVMLKKTDRKAGQEAIDKVNDQLSKARIKVGAVRERVAAVVNEMSLDEVKKIYPEATAGYQRAKTAAAPKSADEGAKKAQQRFDNVLDAIEQRFPKDYPPVRRK